MLLEIAEGVYSLIRVALYIILTATAWSNIIEDNSVQQQSRQKKRKVKKCVGNKKGWQQTDEGGQPLTETALAEHDKSMSEGGKHTPLRATAYTDLNMDPEESIEDWSLWEEGEGGGEGGEEDVDEHEAQQQQLPGSSSNKKGSKKKKKQQTSSPTSHNQQTAAIAEDKDEADVLAVVTGSIDDDISPKMKKKKKKQPLITRMMDKYFYKPVLGKYEGLGYMMYKGFNKTGMRIERGMYCVAENMNGAIRDAGVEAVHTAEEFILRKYLKFFVVWVVLTAVLLPLPSISLSVQMGQ
jgi:hypothetical protein